jgi:hypothetical protein
MSKTVHAVLAPIRNHAKLTPLARLDVDRQKILRDLLADLDGCNHPRVISHVSECLEVLAPRLYDMWDMAGEVKNPPAWLVPLASYALTKAN